MTGALDGDRILALIDSIPVTGPASSAEGGFGDLVSDLLDQFTGTGSDIGQKGPEW